MVPDIAPVIQDGIAWMLSIGFGAAVAGIVIAWTARVVAR